MDFTRILYGVEAGVATLTLHYPANLNAIDEAMCAELQTALDAAEQDAAVKLILIQGSGKAFSSGGDLNHFAATIAAGGNIDPLIRAVGALALAIKRAPKLVLTVVNGVAAGAGANLALAGDLVLASEKTKFIQAFVNIGAVPDAGGGYLLSRLLPAQRALELCLTGRAVTAAEAREWGLVYRVAPPEELDALARETAWELAAGPLLAYRNIKRQMFAAYYADYERYLNEVELPTQSEATRSRDFAEGVTAFLEKRQARFCGE